MDKKIADKKELSNKIKEIIKELENSNSAIKYSQNTPLKNFTTFKIGGPADLLVEVNTKNELIQILQLAAQYEIPYTMLGWGSNILISDKGIRGIVIRNLAKGIRIGDDNQEGQGEPGKNGIKIDIDTDTASDIDTNTDADITPRLDEVEPDEYYSFTDLDYEEPDAKSVEVEIESGAPLPVTIISLIRNGITGLQWFGGIPGTIGGAVFNNIHGGSHFLSEFITSVKVFNPETNTEIVIPAEECEFGYDFSRFHKSKEIILSAKFSLLKGDARKAESVYKEWTRRKKVQPQKSAGCIWKNLTDEEKGRLDLESGSWGYIIDKVLNLKGKSIGGAKISEQHAAFIENTGNATAKDVLALMKLIKEKAQEKFGITPESEIFLMGEGENGEEQGFQN